jgi:hypothetical protein
MESVDHLQQSHANNNNNNNNNDVHNRKRPAPKDRPTLLDSSFVVSVPNVHDHLADVPSNRRIPDENDSSSSPKVLVRPRTRLRLEEEKATTTTTGGDTNNDAFIVNPNDTTMTTATTNDHQNRPMETSSSVESAEAAAGQTTSTLTTTATASNRKRSYHVASLKAPQRILQQQRQQHQAQYQEEDHSNLQKETTTTTTVKDKERVLLFQQQQQQSHEQFLEWCRNVLGIHTILEIQYFEDQRSPPRQPDYEEDLRTEKEEDHHQHHDPKHHNPSFTTTTTSTIESTTTTSSSVRGLAASRDTSAGEILIRIPVQALVSVATTIDPDPVLGHVLGKQARKKHGWYDDAYEYDEKLYTPNDSEKQSPELKTEEEESSVESEEPPVSYELGILAVGLLHHRRLGDASPLAPYVRDILLASDTNDVRDELPFLWDDVHRLRTTVSEGVRIIAQEMRRETRTLYERIVNVLIREYPEIFGYTAIDEHGDWIYSYENFQWAVGIVHSRHWQLAIPDLNDSSGGAATNEEYTTEMNMNSPPESLGEQVPPASVPTEAWIQQQQAMGDNTDVADDESNQNSQGHLHPPPPVVQNELPRKRQYSFLAPVADLLNFGPPCTRTRYDSESKTFQVIATCDLQQGQEVTFWYGNECDDVMMAVYGISHPLIPACKTSEEWRMRVETLEAVLDATRSDLEMLESELDYVETVLKDCDCCFLSSDEEDEQYMDEEEANMRRRGDANAQTTTTATGSLHHGGSSKSASRKSSRGQLQPPPSPPPKSRFRRTVWSRKTEF